MKKGKLSPEKEKKLVKRAKKDVKAFGELYDHYFDSIYTFITYKVGNVHKAEDLTARTFEKAMKNIQKFRWQGYSFGSWLYKIARNLIIDDYRKKKEILSIEEIVYIEDEEHEGPSDQATREIRSIDLMEKVSKLSEDQREIVYLRYIKELSIKETMKITDRTIDSVKSLSKRALKKLKSFYEP